MDHLVVAEHSSAVSCRSGLPRTLQRVLNRLAVGADVTPQEFACALELGVDLPSPTRDVVLGSLMMAAMVRGPRAEEIEALIRGALAVDDPPPAELISGTGGPSLLLAGSGKKGRRTVNVSTPAALVAATAGAQVIKVGSSATSSALGSRDLVHALGIREHRTVAGVRGELAACGFAFVAVEPMIPALDKLYGGRFYAPNPFSFGLAALASPVQGDITVFGLAHPRVDVAARVLHRFGRSDIDVFATQLQTGEFLDEIGPQGLLRRCRVQHGEVGRVEQVSAEAVTGTQLPTDLPAPRGAQDAIEQSIDLLTGCGTSGHRRLVSASAGHLLHLAGICETIADGIEVSDEIIRSGAAFETAQIVSRMQRR